MIRPFVKPPKPLREVRRSGMWIYGNWSQYEGQHEGGTVCVTYLRPPRLPDGKPDLSKCLARVDRWDGVL